MRKETVIKKVKRYEAKHKDSARGYGRVGAHGGNNFAHADAGELRVGGFVSSGAGKAFLIFSVLVLADYILTIYAIRQHFSEFNPLTVFIYKNFQSPELIFFFFKIAVVGLNGLLVYFLLWLKSFRKAFGKIALAYALLAAFFALAVVVYDVGIITGALALPDFANNAIFGFFKLFGLI